MENERTPPATREGVWSGIFTSIERDRRAARRTHSAATRGRWNRGRSGFDRCDASHLRAPVQSTSAMARSGLQRGVGGATRRGLRNRHTGGADAGAAAGPLRPDRDPAIDARATEKYHPADPAMPEAPAKRARRRRARSRPPLESPGNDAGSALQLALGVLVDPPSHVLGLEDAANCEICGEVDS